MSFHKVVLYGISIIGLILSVVVLAREDVMVGSNGSIFFGNSRWVASEPWEMQSSWVQFLNQEIEMSGPNSLFVLFWKPINSPQSYSEVHFDCPMARVVMGEYQDEIRSYQVVRYTPQDTTCIRVFHANDKYGFSWSVSVLSENNFAIRSTFLTTFALRQLLSQYRKDISSLSGTTDLLSQSSASMGSYITQKYRREIDVRDMSMKIWFLQDLLRRRWDEDTYLSPVPWHRVPLGANIIPGAGRPYRMDTTDGIHHGWDIYADIGTPVAAIDDGYILRKVSAFDESDFAHIDRSQPLTPEKQAMNLDIFRGNQVWLLTDRWEVVFYSHLNTLTDWEVGSRVSRWDILGSVGVSGVPEKDYPHSHLHFEIQTPNLASLPRFIPKLETILSWSWVAKDMNTKEVQKITKKKFYWEK